MKSFPAALLFSLVSRLSAQSISAPLPPLAFTGEQDRPQLRNGPRQQRVDGDPGRDGPAKGQAKAYMWRKFETRGRNLLAERSGIPFAMPQALRLRPFGGRRNIAPRSDFDRGDRRAKFSDSLFTYCHHSDR